MQDNRQENQHASNHPTPIRNLELERMPDSSKRGGTSENDGESQADESPVPTAEANSPVKPFPGRRPERSEENTARYRR